MSPVQIYAGGEDDDAIGEVGDAFLEFVDHAISVLSPEGGEEEEEGPAGGGRERRGPSWSWVVSRILKTCLAYSSGVTSAILLSELFQAWSEQNRYATSKKRLDRVIPLKKKKRGRTKLPNTVTIDSICEKNFLSRNSVLEAVVMKAFVLPGTDIYMLNVGDFWSSSTIDLYLHRRYYNLVHPDHGILTEGREISLTGCCLRTGMTGSGRSQLLPTEYLVVLLDEDQDEDALLLGAQFCSDSFSTISLDAFKEGASYSFYARIKSIGPLEVQGKFSCLQRRRVTLIDNDGVKLDFVLWGDQVLLANLFSVGSILALDKPFITTAMDSNIEGSEDICLEYGSATQLYLVPFIQQEEQVLLTSTQLRCQGSISPSVSNQSQDLRISQVFLPLDSQGSVDFRNYPFRSFVIDLQGKMTGISLYGVVTYIHRDIDTAETIYSMTIEDVTGAAVVTGEIEPWSYNLYYRLDMPDNYRKSICSIQILHVEHHHLCSRFLHAVCGHLVNDSLDGSLECKFCCCNCDDEIIRGFHLKVTLQDETARTFAWCIGQTAMEILQISPEDFYELPEVEQAMYLYTLENERFVVALVNSKICTDVPCNAIGEESEPIWEISRAQKCD